MIIYNIEAYETKRLAEMIKIATENMEVTEKVIPNAREKYKDVFSFNEQYIAEINAELVRRVK